MKIAICDDNEEFLIGFENHIEEQFGAGYIADSYRNGVRLIKAYDEGKADYDVIFLDMEMNELSGIDTANEIRKYDKNVIIVFVTAYRKYMERCFECLPFDFLVKPVKKNRFKKMCDRIKQNIHQSPRYITISEKNDILRIACRDILYIQSKGHNLIIYKTDGTCHKTRKRLNEMYNFLGETDFVQTHRSYIINLRHVYKYSGEYILLSGCSKYIPISNSQEKEVRKRFLSYKERKYDI